MFTEFNILFVYIVDIIFIGLPYISQTIAILTRQGPEPSPPFCAKISFRNRYVCLNKPISRACYVCFRVLLVFANRPPHRSWIHLNCTRYGQISKLPLSPGPSKCVFALFLKRLCSFWGAPWLFLGYPYAQTLILVN